MIPIISQFEQDLFIRFPHEDETKAVITTSKSPAAVRSPHSFLYHVRFSFCIFE